MSKEVTKLRRSAQHEHEPHCMPHNQNLWIRTSAHSPNKRRPSDKYNSNMETYEDSPQSRAAIICYRRRPSSCSHTGRRSRTNTSGITCSLRHNLSVCWRWNGHYWHLLCKWQHSLKFQVYDRCRVSKCMLESRRLSTVHCE